VDAYLDHAATSPLRTEARDAMLPWLGERFGNPSGAHATARAARQAIDEARDDVACALGCEPGEVVFVSGGTEADNTALVGGVRARPGRVVVSAIEHHAVLDPAQHLGATIAPVDEHGVIHVDALADALDESVTFVSVMGVNNEVGSIQPLAEIAALVRQKAPEAQIHSDVVQTIPWLDVAAHAAAVDVLSVSAHKFGGPQGVGVLVVRRGASVAPLLVGGGQERDRRSGTHNVAGIVGAAAALVATTENRPDDVVAVADRRDRLVDTLVSRLDGITETVPREHKVAGSAHVCVEDVSSDGLLFLLDRGGVAASAASACASGATQASHVLAAMGLASERAAGALRLTLGPTTTDAEIDHALEVVIDAVARLRG